MNLLERVINFLLSEKREGDESRLVALYPDDDSVLSILEYRENLKDKYDFSNMRELEPEELHATIRWWKVKNGGNTKKIAKNITNIPLKEIEASIKEVSPLGDSLSFMLESEDMQEIFSKVDGLVRSHGAPPSDYPSYLPHVAMFYDESFSNGFDPEIKEVPDFKIRFNRIDFVNNEDKILASQQADKLL